MTQIGVDRLFKKSKKKVGDDLENATREKNQQNKGIESLPTASAPFPTSTAFSRVVEAASGR